MAFYEHLSEINSYLSLMCWEERTSITGIRSDVECISRVDAIIKSSNTVTALQISAKMLTPAMQKDESPFLGQIAPRT